MNPLFRIGDPTCVVCPMCGCEEFARENVDIYHGEVLCRCFDCNAKFEVSYCVIDVQEVKE